jgi:protein-S-isoprenylcysteine O-methyltransferase Ste14
MRFFATRVLSWSRPTHRAAHPHTALELLNEASPAARIAQAAVIVAVVIAVFLLPMALGILVGHLLYTWFGLKVLAIVAGYATTFVVMYSMSLCSIEFPTRPLWLPGYDCD